MGIRVRVRVSYLLPHNFYQLLVTSILDPPFNLYHPNPEMLNFIMNSMRKIIRNTAGLICRSQVEGCRSLFHQYRKYPKHS